MRNWLSSHFSDARQLEETLKFISQCQHEGRLSGKGLLRESTRGGGLQGSQPEGCSCFQCSLLQDDTAGSRADAVLVAVSSVGDYACFHVRSWSCSRGQQLWKGYTSLNMNARASQQHPFLGTREPLQRAPWGVTHSNHRKGNILRILFSRTGIL